MELRIRLHLAELVWTRRAFAGSRLGPAEQKYQQDQDDDGDDANCYVHFPLHSFLFLLRTLLLYSASCKIARRSLSIVLPIGFLHDLIDDHFQQSRLYGYVKRFGNFR